MSEEGKKDPYREFRDEKGLFKSGHNGGPGRPKGKTLKEWARDFLMSMNDQQRGDFIDSLPPEVLWKMAEGNPHNTEDITSGGKPIPILNVSRNNSNKEDKPTEQKDSGDPGGDVSQ